MYLYKVSDTLAMRNIVDSIQKIEDLYHHRLSADFIGDGFWSFFYKSTFGDLTELTRDQMDRIFVCCLLLKVTYEVEGK